MRYYKSYDCTDDDNARRNQLEDEWQEVHRMFHPEEATAEGITSNKRNQKKNRKWVQTLQLLPCFHKHAVIE